MWKFLIFWIISWFIPPALGGFRAALTLPRGVDEGVMLETDVAEDVEGISVLECVAGGLRGTSGLPRGDEGSERESGEPSGLPRSESSAMVG